MAAAADGLVLVVSLGLTDREEAGRVAGQLKAEGVRVLGVVVNRVEPRGRGYYAYYRYRQDRHGPKLRVRWPLGQKGAAADGPGDRTEPRPPHA